jgi:hypothetical protein
MSGPNSTTYWGTEIFYWAIIILVIGCITAIMIASRPGPRTSPANACINNLRQIDAAANQFALEHNLTNGDRINYPDDLTPYIKLNSSGKIPPCPSGGIYHVGRAGTPPTCSLGTTVTPSHVLP